MTTLRDYERQYALEPIYIGDKAHVQVFRTRRHNTWSERAAIVACQFLIPAGLVLGALLSLGMMLFGCYLLYVVAAEVLRRHGGF